MLCHQELLKLSHEDPQDLLSSADAPAGVWFQQQEGQRPMANHRQDACDQEASRNESDKASALTSYLEDGAVHSRSFDKTSLQEVSNGFNTAGCIIPVRWTWS